MYLGVVNHSNNKCFECWNTQGSDVGGLGIWCWPLDFICSWVCACMCRGMCVFARVAQHVCGDPCSSYCMFVLAAQQHQLAG